MEEEREGEKYDYVRETSVSWPLARPQLDLAHNPGTCPDPETKRQPSGLQAGRSNSATPSREKTWFKNTQYSLSFHFGHLMPKRSSNLPLDTALVLCLQRQSRWPRGYCLTCKSLSLLVHLVPSLLGHPAHLVCVLSTSLWEQAQPESCCASLCSWKKEEITRHRWEKPARLRSRQTNPREMSTKNKQTNKNPAYVLIKAMIFG